MTMITPGNQTTPISWGGGGVESVDGVLTSVEGDYIVSIDGSYINIGGGFPSGNSIGVATFSLGGIDSTTISAGAGTGSATWVPGDQV